MSVGTFADLMAEPASEKVFLVEVRPAVQVTEWTLVAGSIYSSEVGELEIESVTEDGVALTGVDVPGSLSAGEWAVLGNRFYLSPSSGNPEDHVYALTVLLRYATKDIALDGYFYEGRILSVPVMNQQKEDPLWGVSILSDGTVSLSNADALFDEISETWCWNNRRITIRLGGGELPYSEYEEMFSGLITEKNLGMQLFDLAFEDARGKWKESLYVHTFELADYPNLGDVDIGAVVPLVWGTVKAFPVVCTTAAAATGTHSFKAADTSLHPLQSIDAVYVNGVAVTPASSDAATGSFTLSTSLFAVGNTVTADVHGFCSGTVLIQNPVDVVKEIAEIVDPTGTWDATELAASRAEAEIYRVGLPVYDFKEALGFASDLMRSCLGSFFLDAAGKYRITIWNTDIPSAPTELDERHVGNISAKARTENLRRMVRAGWAKRWSEGKYSYKQVTQAEVEYLYGITRSRTIETLLADEASVTIFLARLQFMCRFPTVEVSFASKLQLALMNIGDRFSLSYSRVLEGTDLSWLAAKIVEITNISKDFSAGVIRVTVDDLKGLSGIGGHWMDSVPTFPPELGGSTVTAWDKTWSAAQKAYAKGHFGFWLSSTGYADATDPDSFMVSRWW